MNDPLWHPKNDLPSVGVRIVALCNEDVFRVGWFDTTPRGDVIRCLELYYKWDHVLFWAYADELAQHVHNSLPKESP